MGDLIDVRASMGVDSGRHTCWGYGDEEVFWQEVAGFVAEGLENGEHIVSVVPPHRSAGVPPPGVEADRWRTLTIEEFYGDPGTGTASEWEERTRRILDDAARRDLPGVRLVTDATHAVTHSRRNTILEWELELDRLTSEYPFKVVCGLQPGVVDKESVADMAAVHLALRGEMPAPLASLHVVRSTLFLRGEFDLTTRGLLELALNRARKDNDLDLTHVTFMDLDSIEMLRRFTQAAESEGRPVQLRGMPDIIERCWHLLEREQ